MASPLSMVRDRYRDIFDLSGTNLFVPDILCAAYLANSLHRAVERTWLYVVGRPGSGKTEMVRPFIPLADTVFLNRITDKTLISGFVTGGSKEPSLLPRLDGKVLLSTDYTSHMGIDPQQAASIDAVLREAYDGEAAGGFGTGEHKHFTSRFGVVACVTTDIDYYVLSRRSLGERFVNFWLCSPQNALERRRRANHINHISQTIHIWRPELHALILTAIDFAKKCVPADPASQCPALPEPTYERMTALADLCARCRTMPRATPQNPYQAAMYVDAEDPSRLTKQFATIAWARAYFDNRDAVDDSDLDLVAYIALSSMPRFVQIALELMAPRSFASVASIAETSGLPPQFVTTVLTQLQRSEITQCVHKAPVQMWALTPYAKALIGAGRLPLPQPVASAVVTAVQSA